MQNDKQSLVMNRVRVLHNNPKHNLAENTEFILRLRFKKNSEAPLKSDAIILLQQYLYLYQAFEDRLEQLRKESIPYLSIFYQEPWQSRTIALKQDINKLQQDLTTNEKNQLPKDSFVFPAMAAMIQEIKYGSPTSLFAFLAVRSLGDTFGGQKLNQYTKQLFSSKNFGGQFYQQVYRQTFPLVKFINEANLTVTDEKLFFNIASQVFQYHIELFNQIEDSRKQNNKSLYPAMRCSCAFFAISSIVTVTAALGISYLNKRG